MKYLLPLLLVLAGCIGDQANKQDGGQPVINITPASPVPAEVSKADLEKLHNETTASTNNSQQAITGLGANIAKVAEKMTGIEGDLSAVKASFSTNINAVSTAVAKLDTDVAVNAAAVANIKAEFDAKISAQAQINTNAVAALKSEISTSTQTISAGRDSSTQTTQFTKEMMQTLEAGYKAQIAEIKSAFYAIIAIVHIFAGVLIAFMRGSVNHERTRHDLAMDRLMRGTGNGG